MIKTIQSSSLNLLNTLDSSREILQKSSKLTFACTTLDFFMQVYPGIMGTYLVYTAIRCSILAIKLLITENTKKVYEEAQLYFSTKTVGLVMSQSALLLLGLTSPASALLILGWGVILCSISTSARYKANSTTN